MSRRGAHPGGGAFIESYIAPDMHMRPVGQTVDLLESAGFEVRDVHALREHYVRTVDAWYDTFEQRWDDAVALVGEEVARVWRLYFVGGGARIRRRGGWASTRSSRSSPDRPARVACRPPETRTPT